MEKKTAQQLNSAKLLPRCTMKNEKMAAVFTFSVLSQSLMGNKLIMQIHL